MTALHDDGADQETAVEIVDQKRSALRLMAMAFEESADDGVDPDCMTQAALFYALKEFVLVYGEEAVARFAEGLPQRIRDGEFTVIRHG
jgi:hypothetical protein